MKNKEQVSSKELPEKYEARFRDILDRIPEKERAGKLGADEAKSIKSGLLEKYKGLEQEIEFIFSEIAQLKDQERIGKLKEYDGLKTLTPGGEQEIQGIKLSLTESFFLQASYILANREDKEYLRNLLDLTDRVAWRLGEARTWRAIRKGLLGEVALHHLLEERGLSPKLPHPREDATLHIDMWAEDEKGRAKIIAQVKHTAFAQKPHFLQSKEELSDWLEGVGERVKDDGHEGGVTRFAEMSEKLKTDFAEMENYCLDRPEEIKPVVVIFPEGSIDPYSGELVEEYFKDFEIKLD
ncbi:MAG: hypothetical protein HY813_01250 [Candidatus Portnoybacteria bacterium]|nr:hypothetical protein [Candidatus Portnoybacteria bacterium]